MARWIARITETPNPTHHYEGAPPGVLGEGFERTLMPEANWVIMEANKDGVFLIRYSETGEFGGDTWTLTRELALEVAADEYGLHENDWIEVPDNVADPIGFGRTTLSTRLQ